MRLAQPDGPTTDRAAGSRLPIEDQEDHLILDRNPQAHGIGTVLFSIFIAIVFTVPGVFLVGHALKEPAVEFVVFAIGWLLFCLLIWNGLLKTLFSRERLRLDAEGLNYLWIDGLVRRRRLIPLAEIQSVSLYSVMVGHGDSETLHAEHGLSIGTLGRPLCCGQGLDRSDITCLQARIEQHLRELKPGWVNSAWSGDREVLERWHTLREPPSDSTIRCRREWDRTEFIRRFSTDWIRLLGLLPMALIFCVILGGLTVELSRKFDWFVVWGLIPVGLGGLALIAPWVSAGLGRRRWVVRPGEITTDISFLGLGWSRTVEVEWLDRIELRRVPRTTKRPLWPQIGFQGVQPGFELTLIDQSENDVAIIGPVTEGEARWIAGILAEVLKDAFLKDGQTFARWSVTADAPAAGAKALGDRWLDEASFS